MKKNVLTVALSSLLGAAFALTFSPLFPLIALFLRDKKGYATFCLAAIYTLAMSPPPSLQSNLRGNASFIVENIKPIENKLYLYEGKIRSLKTGEKTIARNLPCTFCYNKLIKGNRLLIEEATLKPLSRERYCLNLKKKPTIHEGKTALPYLRYLLKEKIITYVKKHYPSRRSQALMITFLTSFSKDPLLHYEFARIGLSHILAISGLHFGVIALFLSAIISRFTKHHVRHFILFSLLTLYMIFLGKSPSVTRAYIAISYYLTARYFRFRFCALAALGCAILFALITNPRVIYHLGFQLSFAATGGILLYYEPIKLWLERLVPKYPYHHLIHLSRGDQIVHILARPLRMSLALALSVNVMLFPLLLYHFQTFPFLSLVYNLVLPPFLLLSLLLVLIAVPIPFLHSINHVYTETILLISKHPLPDLTLKTAPFHYSVALLAISALTFWGLSMQKSHVSDLTLNRE